MRDSVLAQRAKTMRHEGAEPERRFWNALRARRFDGVKFRRQKVIGTYIVDFAARAPMVVIEIDGDTHGDRLSEDAVRTRSLEQQGYEVVRFTNAEIMNNLEGVLTSIGTLVAKPPLPTLSPKGERAS